MLGCSVLHMTTTRAAELGRTAFANGAPSAPTLNAEIREAIANLPVGVGAVSILRAFSEAWHAENLATVVL